MTTFQNGSFTSTSSVFTFNAQPIGAFGSIEDGTIDGRFELTSLNVTADVDFASCRPGSDKTRTQSSPRRRNPS